MENEPNFPAIDPHALAKAFLGRVGQSGDGQSVRIVISAEQVRQLAQQRIRLAFLTLPICLLLGAAVLLISPSLALVAVLCGFFAYACISIARQQRELVKAAADLEVTVSGKQFHIAGRPPRDIFLAVNRPDYLRLVLTSDKVVALWLDNRRNPDASFDLPTSLESRREVCAALKNAGVKVQTEGSAQRVVVLLGSLAVALFALTAARVALKLTASVLLASPLAWAFLGVLGLGVGVFWLRQPKL